MKRVKREMRALKALRALRAIKSIKRAMRQTALKKRAKASNELMISENKE